MKTFRTYPGRTEEVYPEAIRLVLCANHQYLTFADDCECTDGNTFERYGVIGTQYGHYHNCMGDWWLWATPSPAYAAARELRDYYQV